MSPKSEFTPKNIIAIPNFLTQVFIQLESTDPFTVAKAFIAAIYDFDMSSTDSDDNNMSKATLEKETFNDQNGHDDDNNDEDQDEQANLANKIQLQSPVLYSLSSNNEIDNWYQALPVMSSHKQINHRPTYKTTEFDSKASIPCSKRKISRKDNYLINTMIKLHDTIDKNSKNKEEKDPGFIRLKLHRKKLIHNASAVLF